MSSPLPGPPDLSALLNLAEIEAAGRARMTLEAMTYYAGGANDEHTLRANRESFARLKLLPRVLVDVSEIDTRAAVLGQMLSFPVGIAPSAMHGLAHPDAELGTARAAAQAGSLMTLSTMSTSTIEDVAHAAAGRLWFQLYLYRDREVSREVVQRAAAAGARALVLTVDAPQLGRREGLKRHPLYLPDTLTLPNVGPRRPGTEHLTPIDHFNSLLDPSLSWQDLDWLRGVTDLPIVLKGIHSPADAERAAERGCHVWLSNHGGRQLDTAVTPLDVLPETRRRVGDRAEVYLDGGVTRGTDLVKALALGADAVFLGRAALWGLAAGGQAGVEHTLALLHDEFRLAMALCGVTRVADLTPDLIWRG